MSITPDSMSDTQINRLAEIDEADVLAFSRLVNGNLGAALAPRVAVSGVVDKAEAGKIATAASLDPVTITVHLDDDLRVMTLVEALASANLTLYRAPYRDAVPIICTMDRAREFHRRAAQQEAARDESLTRDR